MKRRVYSKQVRKRTRLETRDNTDTNKTSLPKVDVLFKGHRVQAKKASKLNKKTEETSPVTNGQEQQLVVQTHSEPVAQTPVETTTHISDEAASTATVVSIQTTSSSSVQGEQAPLAQHEPGRVFNYMYPPTSYSLQAKELPEYPPSAEYTSGYNNVTYTALQAAGPLENQTHTVAQSIEQHWDQENTDRFHSWRLSDGYPLASVHPNYNYQDSYEQEDTYSQPDSQGQSDSRVSTRRTAGMSKAARRRRKRLQTPVQRSAANMRERRRMNHLNIAFDLLKERLPNVKDKKKLSRIQTLKAAIYYIHLLRDTLNLQ